MSAVRSFIPGPGGAAGRYEVREKLGRGGMGTVYRAVDLSTGRQLAVKRLQRDLVQSGDAVLRFRQEFHTLARLKHPRIVEVYDYGIDAVGPYYTMELLDGEDFRTRAPAEAAEACRLLRDVASALAFLHSRRLLHCDIAGRNVRCTSDGRAKLIDFGALATMGLSRQVVGTPPFIAPEALRGLPLDQRADLFGLGALAYWLLTAHHAFPAVEVNDLLRLWHTPPRAPSALVPGLPGALDELVLSLLSIDPLGRLTSAAEVMERLDAIAGLENAAELDVARAYLESGALVGREREMEKARRRLRVTVQQRRGQVLCVEAPAGAGKSRFLREIGLEAQLAGAVVLPIVASPIRGQAYGLARQLVAALLQAVPRVARRTLQSRAAVLMRIFPEVAAAFPEVSPAAEASDPRELHARTQSQFSEWLLEIADAEPLVILLDDLQHADEASAALFASLGRAASKAPLLLALTLRSGHSIRAAGSVAVLRELGSPLHLRELEEEHVRQLVVELFGEARYAGRLAQWIHQAAGGSPLLCLELARHLVARGVVRYVEGLWVLPEVIDEADLPKAVPEAMDSLARSVGDEARRLAEVLSVHGGELPLELCVTLSEAQDAEEVFTTLDELVVREILVGSRDGYRFRNDGLREAYLRQLDPNRKRRLHIRVAEALAAGGTGDRDVEMGWHFLYGGEPSRAAPLLERGGRRLYEEHAFADAVEPLEAAWKAYSDTGRSAAERMELAFALVAAGYMGDGSLIARYAPDTIRSAAIHAGIGRIHLLRRVLGASPAVALGVAGAAVRRRLTPGRERGPAPAQALRIYVMSVIYSMAAATAGLDVQRMRELLEQLEPLAGFERSLSHPAYLTAGMLHDFMVGRHAEIRRRANEIIEKVRFNEGLDPLDRKVMEGTARALAALVPAADGDPACLDDVEALNRLGLRVSEVAALQTRIYYHLCRGELETARRHQAEHESLSAQVGSTWQMQGWRAATEAVAHGHIGDVLGLKRSIEELSRLVQREGFRGYLPNLELARGEYYRERGQLLESREALERALALMPFDRSVYREVTLAAYCETLAALGDHAGTAAVAEETLRHGEERNRTHAVLRCGRALALSEAARGRLDESVRRLDALIERATGIGNPAACGALHEARAQVALLQGDSATFEKHLRLTERWFRATENPVLVRRWERLRSPATDDPGRAPSPAAAGALSTIRDIG